jgi:uncharacterized ferritin-like protein (DUF455 family)
MELREWAIRILSADTLEEKLLCPEILTDEFPGEPLIFNEPVRPAGMSFNKRTKEQKLPHFQNHGKEENRAVCLHRFAGHELLAVEIMAHALIAFPNAPKAFRKGVAHTLKEEQGHVKLYIQRMEQLGVRFGDLPLFKHFWNHVPYLTTPLRYVSVMSLTFEMANLDFAPLYGRSFAAFGDELSAALMAQILKDEINHVSFGFSWLNKFKGENPAWNSWIDNLSPKIVPKRAKGFVLIEENRRKAGIPGDWIEKLKLA